MAVREFHCGRLSSDVPAGAGERLGGLVERLIEGDELELEEEEEEEEDEEEEEEEDEEDNGVEVMDEVAGLRLQASVDVRFTFGFDVEDEIVGD